MREQSNIERLKSAVNSIEWAKSFPFEWMFLCDFVPGKLIFFEGRIGRLLDKGINCIRIRFGDIVEYHYRPGAVTPELAELIIQEKKFKTKKELSEEFGLSVGKIDYVLYGLNDFSMDYWTKEEDEFLTENRDKGTKWIASKLKKKKWDVDRRILILELGRINADWSAVDDEEIMKLYKRYSASDLAELYNTSESAVRNRLVILRRKGLITYSKDVRDAWTDEEEEYIKDNLGDLKYSEIADNLGRSLSSVKSKIQRIYSSRRSKK